MIELGIVDLSASARRRLASLVERWTWVSPNAGTAFPRISIHLLSPEEVRFHGALDVCVVGPELLACDAAYVATLRRELTDKLILCVLDGRTQSYSSIEQLGRLGVDDVLLESASGDEFLRRLVLLQRRIRSKTRGQLVIVDSARGGVGATFVSAMVAEGWIEEKRSVCVVDCDCSSHDLTRFLNVKPHVSEPLRLLLEQQRLITKETVSECTHSVWADEPLLKCVPPPAGCDVTALSSEESSRSFLSVLETMAQSFEQVLVDASPLPESLKHALHQVADVVLFVTNRDPSAAFANRQALTRACASLRPEGRVVVIVNDTGGVAASQALLKREVFSLVSHSIECVCIPHSKNAARWPCSGRTPYRFLHRHIRLLLGHLTAVEGTARERFMERWKKRWKGAVRAIFSRLCWWREAGESSGVVEDHSSGLRNRELSALGIHQALLGDGELISKPVLIG